MTEHTWNRQTQDSLLSTSSLTCQHTSSTRQRTKSLWWKIRRWMYSEGQKKKKESSLGALRWVFCSDQDTHTHRHTPSPHPLPPTESGGLTQAAPAPPTRPYHCRALNLQVDVATVHSQAVNKISTQYRWARLFSFPSQYKLHEANHALIAGVPVIFKKSILKKLWLLTTTKCKNDSLLQRIQLRHKVFWGFSCLFFFSIFIWSH